MRNEHVTPAVRKACAEALLDRGWGRPKEHIEIGSGSGAQIDKIIEEFVGVPYRDITEIEDQRPENPQGGNGKCPDA